MTTFLRWAVLAATTALILALTLAPGQSGETVLISLGVRGFRVVADGLVNAVLFVPFGVAAALAMGGARPVAAGAALSLAVELLQLGVPGRYTSPADLVFNTLGAAVGMLLVRRRDAWLRPSGALRIVLPAGAAAAALAVLAGGPFLFAPYVPHLPLFGQWTPDFADRAKYDGRILEATVGDMAVPSRRIAEWPRLRERLLAGDTVRVRFIAGSRTPAPAPIFNIFDNAVQDVLATTADGHDLVVRIRMLSREAGLDQPEFRIPDALAPFPPGTAVEFRLWRDGTRYCAALDANLHCGLELTVGHTWSLLMFPVPAPLAAVLPFVWIAAVVTPAAFWSRRPVPLAGFAVLIVAALAATPVLAGIAATPASAYVAALAGILCGAAAARAVARDRRM